MKRRGLHIHFYCKLVVLFAALVLSFIAPSETRSLYLMVVLTVFALLQFQLKNTLYFWGFFLAIVGLLFLYQYFAWPDDVVSRYTFVIMRNTLPAFLALFLLGSTPVSEITSGFDSLRFPKRTGIAIVTLFRYIPTLGQDVKTAYENLKLRGLGGAGNLVAHPARTVRCFALPLMTHLSSTAEELAISATARGAESPQKRYSLYGKRFGAVDGVILIVMLAGLAGVLFV
jgi:energy-coupling factor transporter transmembrane protein EcfT